MFIKERFMWAQYFIFVHQNYYYIYFQTFSQISVTWLIYYSSVQIKTLCIMALYFYKVFSVIW